MRVLICGHRSFAARGLPDLLRGGGGEGGGHEVTCFSRGPVDRRASEGGHVTVTGPVDEIHANPHLQGRHFDAVVNYILLKDLPIAPNLAYIDSLRFCREQGVPHLLHVSSISSYKGNIRVVTEDAELEKEFEKKGSYGSIKAATEDHITRNVPPDTKLSLLRPGFILGDGLLNPIVGTAVRYPSNQLLVIGNANSHIPMISREQVNESVKRIVENPPQGPREAFLLAAPNSPTRLKFLEACCTRLGAGSG